jgi:hypothetical protein
VRRSSAKESGGGAGRRTSDGEMQTIGITSGAHSVRGPDAIQSTGRSIAVSTPSTVSVTAGSNAIVTAADAE